MPSVLSPVVDPKTGRLTPAWVNYLKGLQEVSSRVSVNIPDVGGGATLADVITAFNSLLAAMQAASQQDLP